MTGMALGAACWLAVAGLRIPANPVGNRSWIPILRRPI